MLTPRTVPQNTLGYLPGGTADLRRATVRSPNPSKNRLVTHAGSRWGRLLQANLPIRTPPRNPLQGHNSASETCRNLARRRAPNIDSGSTHALVLELVEGPTLADRIAKGALPLERGAAHCEADR